MSRLVLQFCCTALLFGIVNAIAINAQAEDKTIVEATAKNGFQCSNIETWQMCEKDNTCEWDYHGPKGCTKSGTTALSSGRVVIAASNSARNSITLADADGVETTYSKEDWDKFTKENKKRLFDADTTREYTDYAATAKLFSDMEIAEASHRRQLFKEVVDNLEFELARNLHCRSAENDDEKKTWSLGTGTYYMKVKYDCCCSNWSKKPFEGIVIVATNTVGPDPNECQYLGPVPQLTMPLRTLADDGKTTTFVTLRSDSEKNSNHKIVDNSIVTDVRRFFQGQILDPKKIRNEPSGPNTLFPAKQVQVWWK